MSQSNPPLTTTAVPAAPAAAPPGPRERRVRFGHLALAIALVVVGALGTAALVAAASADGEYLAVTRDVGYGAQLTQADLVTVRISNPPGVDPVPANRINRVVGNYAAMPLAAGTLLTAAHVTDADHREPGAGEVRVGITLPGDRLPGRPVQPGHRILLVATGSGAEPETPAPRTWEATVVDVAGAGSGSGSGILGGGRSQETTLDVIVPVGDGPAIAALAAADELVVAVLAGQSGS
jgi:hypothetical protein